MFSNVIKSNLLRIFLFGYLAVMLVLYPVSRMYADEYVTLPIKFEFSFFMVILGAISNTGIFLALSEWGLKHKKITCASLLFAAIMNALLLLITNGNPLQFVSYESWNKIRYSCFYGVFLVSGILCILVGRYKDESR